VKRDASALVLSQGDTVLAAELARDRSEHDRARIFFRMQRWMNLVLVRWIRAHEITELGIVLVEDDPDGLSRTASNQFKLRLAGAMETGIYQLVAAGTLECDIRLGRIGYRAAKAVFTGDGNASNTKLILASKWERSRGEKFERERSILAMAQAASVCRPTMITVEDAPFLDSYYTEAFTGG